MSAEPSPLVHTEWRINDSGRRFRVIVVGDRYATVENVNGPKRSRRILLSALKTSNAKTGYTQVTQ